MLGIFFSIDICTLFRKSSKNVDLNICAPTWHSVSVIGHKQGFDLAVSVILLNINVKNRNSWLGKTLTCSDSQLILDN